MADEKTSCPYCAEMKERRVVPFNPDEGIEVTCEDCFRDLSADKLEAIGILQLQALANGGYFAQENFGYLKAIEGFNRYMAHLKKGAPAPFRVTGSLIIANDCS